ncbi:hypothetical protein ANCCAN_13602 [Ancylostoma caninum]|uniref:Uncharacterized protein n=1 Tax=Ancylostoma caninum TaxID=29170 RepID=A0A368G7N6_ANCCA|nr:hypothetical protein ANCCAN_13602 [Ancylostoma caninum]
MGAYLDKPVTEKESESGHGNGLTYGATCMQGWRVKQEVAVRNWLKEDGACLVLFFHNFMDYVAALTR